MDFVIIALWLVTNLMNQTSNITFFNMMCFFFSIIYKNTDRAGGKPGKYFCSFDTMDSFGSCLEVPGDSRSVDVESMFPFLSGNYSYCYGCDRFNAQVVCSG